MNPSIGKTIGLFMRIPVQYFLFWRINKMSERSEKAVALFKSGASCAQAVVAAYADLFGLDQEMAMRVAGGLGGGVGRMREVCGVVLGMAILAGLKAGNRTPEDQEGKKAAYELVQKMAKIYKEEYGSIVCKQLLGLEKPEGSPVPEARTPTYYKKRPCAEMVGFGARIVDRVLLGEE